MPVEVIAGTALVALGGRVLAGRRNPGLQDLLRLALAITLSLVAPPALAPGVIGVGWLLSLGERTRGWGWDGFGVGCAILGRGLLGQTSPPEQGIVVVALWLIGWGGVRVPGAWRSRSRYRLRWELVRASRALAPRAAGEAWRVRASDALSRAIAEHRSASNRWPGPASTVLSRTVASMFHGAEALADADGEAARIAFMTARRALVVAAGDSPHRREELRQWLEIIDWCTAAATLIDEEDPP